MSNYSEEEKRILITEFITNGIMKTEVNQELYRIIQELVEGI